MRTCLVTGGAGFIGSHLAEALVRRGDRVRVLDNLSSGYEANLASVTGRFELIKADVNDAAAVDRALEGVDVVFHEAAVASVPRSVAAPLETHLACTTGTLMMLDRARAAGVKRFVYAASSSAYGNQPTPLKRETDLPTPLSPYAVAKLAGEHYCQAFYHTYGLETVCLRYFNVFGPRQDPNGPYAAVIPIFIESLLAGRSPNIYGDGGQTRDFTYVADVVAANLRASEAQAAGVTVNIGCGRSISLNDLLVELNALLGTKIEANFQPPRAGDVRHSLADISLANELIGHRPEHSLRDGLIKTIEFYRTQQATAG